MMRKFSNEIKVVYTPTQQKEGENAITHNKGSKRAS